MTQRDALGRRRAPGQNRGLRPLYPPLPPGAESRSVRVAMAREAWALVDRYLVERCRTTGPRALGELVERAVRQHERERVADWQEWQIRKEQLLLARRTDEAAAS